MENQNQEQGQNLLPKNPPAPPPAPFSDEPEVELTEKEEKAIEIFSKTLDLEAAPKNSVLIVKLGTEDHLYANNLQMGIIQRVLNPRVDILREKKLTVLFMAREDDISLLTEEDMEKAGWVKKEPSLIIKP